MMSMINRLAKIHVVLAVLFCAGLQACQSDKKEDMQEKPIKLLVLEPGHFHAALVQKSMHNEIDSVVHVYASEGQELEQYLEKIKAFNSREENPTRWEEKVYAGPAPLDKMIAEKAGNVVVLAGNNKEKTAYIKRSADAGLHVLSDKPMAIDEQGFTLLKDAFASAEKNGTLIYDIMTGRRDIINVLQRELTLIPEIFGELRKGTEKEPAVIKESIHHFFKYVAGKPLVRPAWYFDVQQQGEGIVDVTTHMIDLIQWSCFPETIIDYNNDIVISDAKRSFTAITPSQFKKVTGKDGYPAYLSKDLKDSLLHVYSNGEILYKIKDVHAKISVTWNYEAPEGSGDTHYSEIKGTKASILVRQGKAQSYKPVLYIRPEKMSSEAEKAIADSFKSLVAKYPGVELKKAGNEWEVIIPERYHTGHEAHFSEVASQYIDYVKSGKLPDWEVPNMLAKYYTTTQALKKARSK